MTLEEFENGLKNKNVTVIGIGISNRPLIEYLVRIGANVTACDRRTAEDLGAVYDEMCALGVKLSLGDDYLADLRGDVIFKTPGMRYDVAELVAARERGSIVTSEMEAFFEVCPAHIIAVTGSDGKTTTTTLIHKMLTAAGYTAWLGGNIGNPLLADTYKMKPDDMVVLELSSFQLHTMKKSPERAVITNISPNHLDMHKDYAEYIDAKKNIMRYQSADNLLVVNADNDVTRAIGGESAAKTLYFSRQSKADIYLDANFIKRGGEDILDIRDIKIPGMHNVENYMAAIGVVGDMVGKDVIVEIAKTFGGVEHRIELVRELDGVRFYNSSIDSSPNRTINTLRVFNEPVVMIAGGKDKGIPYDEIGAPIVERVKSLILIGKTADKIETAVKAADAAGKVKIIRAETYPEAVNAAREEASAGDVVLLSPASTSFDMFRNFEERGNLFKEIVNSL